MKIELRTPFSFDYSKNKTWGHNRRGFKYIRNEARRIRDNLLVELKNQVGKKKFEKRKVYITLLIVKPTMRGDCINFIDSICDVIKKAIEIDDNMFALSVDWEINKDKPYINIVIEQTDPIDNINGNEIIKDE